MGEWLFGPENLDETVASLVGAQHELDVAEAVAAVFRRRIVVAESAMTRLQRAVEAGWAPPRRSGQAERGSGAGGWCNEKSRWSVLDLRLVCVRGETRTLTTRLDLDAEAVSCAVGRGLRRSPTCR